MLNEISLQVEIFRLIKLCVCVCGTYCVVQGRAGNMKSYMRIIQLTLTEG